MIKKLGKHQSKNGEYTCGICGTEFPTKDEKGHRIAQKIHLKPATYLKFGNHPIAIMPKMCYRCDALMKRKVMEVFNG